MTAEDAFAAGAEDAARDEPLDAGTARKIARQVPKQSRSDASDDSTDAA